MSTPQPQIPGPPTAEQLAQLEYFRKVLTKSLTYTTALYACLCFDWVMTLPQEYNRYWKRKWNASTYIFLFNRYFGLAALTAVEILFNANISYDQCSKAVWLEPGMLMGMILAAETLLILRVWALWDRAVWVPCLFVLMVSAEVGVSIWAVIGSEALPIPPQLNISPCILNSSPKNASRLWLYWFCPVVTDSVIVLLVIIRSYQLYKRAGGAKVPLLKVLVRDGLLFYVCVLAANLLNVIWFKTKPVTENQALHAPLAMVVTTLAASRLSLSMRDPSYAETSAASLSRYKTTKAGDTTLAGHNNIGKGDGVPTYPLEDLRRMDESQTGLAHFDDEEKVVSKNGGGSNSHASGRGFGNLSRDGEAKAYQGVYIQSQTHRNVAVSADQPNFEKQLFQ